MAFHVRKTKGNRARASSLEEHKVKNKAPSRGTQDEVETPRVIGPFGAFAVVAGAMLGVGIFLFPSKVAVEVDSIPAFFVVWLLGGVFALSGSVACGELGAMIPKAGGDYVFQREAFGPSMAFASGWVLFAAIFCGSIASMSVAVFQYQVSELIGIDLAQSHALMGVSWAKLLAIALIVFLTFINHLGTRMATSTQVLLTLTPIAALALLSLWVLGTSPPSVLAAPVHKLGASELSMGGLAAGFMYVNFAFSGWINIIYVASEVEEPGKNIPRSMILATLGVTALYLLLCVAFISVLGFAGLSALGWTDAGTGLAEALGMPHLKTAIVLLIATAIITSTNATVLGSARVAYAMSKDGAFWRGAATLSGAHRVPRNALWLQAALASAIVLSGTFEEIVKMASIAMFVTGMLTVLSMFVLRRTRPDANRPYRATFYPVLPGLYVVLSLIAILVSIWQAVRQGSVNAYYPLIGLALLILIFVAHLVWHPRSHSHRP